jgi:hypothetical protein
MAPGSGRAPFSWGSTGASHAGRARGLTAMEHIEVRCFDGCPSWRDAWSALGTVLAEMGCEVPVRLRDVTRMDREELVGFAGSPTIRVDGADLFGYRGPLVMACRRYEEDGGQGWPSVDSLRQRLGAAERATRPEADGDT